MNGRRLGFVLATDPQAQAAAITATNAPPDDPIAAAMARSNQAIFDAQDTFVRPNLIAGVPQATLFYGLVALVGILLLMDAKRK